MTEEAQPAEELEAEARAIEEQPCPALNQAAPAAATDLGFATDAVRPDPPARAARIFHRVSHE